MKTLTLTFLMTLSLLTTTVHAAPCNDSTDINLVKNISVTINSNIRVSPDWYMDSSKRQDIRLVFKDGSYYDNSFFKNLKRRWGRSVEMNILLHPGVQKLSRTTCTATSSQINKMYRSTQLGFNQNAYSVDFDEPCPFHNLEINAFGDGTGNTVWIKGPNGGEYAEDDSFSETTISTIQKSLGNRFKVTAECN